MSASLFISAQPKRPTIFNGCQGAFLEMDAGSAGKLLPGFCFVKGLCRSFLFVEETQNTQEKMRFEVV